LSEKTKIALGVILALVLAFSLAGVSCYFPSSQETSLFPSLPTGEGNLPSQIPEFSVCIVINLPNITIRADGTIEPQDVPIQRIGNMYTLTDDIVNQTLRIQRDNIVIDGAGHKIQGDINAAEGMVLQNRSNVTLKNMEVTRFWNGISVTSCSSIAITGTKVMNIGSRAIMLDSCNNSIISDNVVDDVAIAIEITATSGFSANNTVTRNIITSATQGITIDGSFSTITENNLANIYLPIGARGNQTTISKNNLANGIGGIYLTGSYCTIYGNNVANFSESGMTINLGTNSSIYENNVSYSECAIIIQNYEDTWIIENNTFYHNNFINNTQTIRVESPSHQNYWDNGSEGNYWSDYNGADHDGDGIGDTSYMIDANNIDSYPLMTPYESMQQPDQMLWVYLGIIGLGVFAAIVIGIMLVSRQTKAKSSLENIDE
jgi:nitrous oxidase accessory protein NosD